MERWNAIPSEPGYEASDLGRVRSVDRIITYRDGRRYSYQGRVLKAADDGKGYRLVGLPDGTRRVHSLVLNAFIGPRPPGMEACHNDGNRANNHLVNLRWDTASSNQMDSVRHGTQAAARRAHCVRGHLLSPPNLVASTLGNRAHRACLACRRARVQVGALSTTNVGHLDAVADAKYLEIMQHGAGRIPRTHCPRGHLLAEPNLQLSDLRRGKRNCLACRRASRRIWNLRAQGYGADEVNFDVMAHAYYSQIMKAEVAS